ncbi:HD domain-containing protein [Blastopirellula marina]
MKGECMSYEPRPLPDEVQRLCTELDAPPRLVAHLILVHDVSVDLVEGLRQKFPDLEFDHEAVCFGAASHDFSKIKFPNELTGPGRQHEDDAFLRENGIEPRLAKFCRTHNRWMDEELPIEDLLVALSDAIWKGQRIDELEKQVIDKITEQTGVEQWEVFSELDVLLEEIASLGDERLAWQRANG